jgi:hypothetical protein
VAAGGIFAEGVFVDRDSATGVFATGVFAGGRLAMPPCCQSTPRRVNGRPRSAYNQLWRATQKRAKNPPSRAGGVPANRRKMMCWSWLIPGCDETMLRPKARLGEDGQEPFGRSESVSGEMVKSKRTDPLLDRSHRELLKTVLEEEKLKFDRKGNRRTAYSLRHIYICLRLLEGGTSIRSPKTAGLRLR